MENRLFFFVDVLKNQRVSTILFNTKIIEGKKIFACVVFTDEPTKYSIVESKRLLHVNGDGFGVIKELGKSYNVRIEQTGMNMN